MTYLKHIFVHSYFILSNMSHWQSGQHVQTRSCGLDSQHFHNFKSGLGLELDPSSLIDLTEHNANHISYHPVIYQSVAEI